MTVDPKTAAPGADNAVVRPAEEVPFKNVAAGRDTQMQVLVGPAEGAPNYVLRRFRMQKGGGMPLHTNEVEHEQYVLRGRAKIRVGSDVHDVRADDTLYIPAGVPHSYEVVEAPFEFLCIVPNAPDQIKIQEEGC
jgi:quercetin dioxygenase-like cupin family protein